LFSNRQQIHRIPEIKEHSERNFINTIIMDIQIKSLKTAANSVLSCGSEVCNIKENKRKTGNAKMHYTTTKKKNSGITHEQYFILHKKMTA
jgi:hypothetical protein